MKSDTPFLDPPSLREAEDEVARKITQHNKTERQLMESEGSLRLFIEHAPAAVAMFDREMRYLAVSSNWVNDFQLHDQDIVGRSHYEIFPEIPDRWKEVHQRGLRGEVVKSVEDRFERMDGSIQWLRWVVRPWYNADGGVGGIVIFAEDITERKASGEALRESEARFRLLVESAPDAIFVQTQGCFAYANKAACSIFGYESEDQLLGNPVLPHFHIVDRKAVEERIRILNNEKRPVPPREETCLRADGSTVPVEISAVPVHFKGRDGALVFMRDISDRKEAEAALRKSEERLLQSQKMEAIGTLAGGIAHDFNNILFAMTGYTELAMESLPPNSEIRSDLQRVLDAGKRAGQMVKQILTFSRQSQPERQPLDLGPIVKEGLKFLRGSIPTTIEISQSVQPNLGKVYGDPTQVHQVLMNFCTNAVHAMGHGKGLLSVELSAVEIDQEDAAGYPELVAGKYVRLTVGDTGHGIPREILPRIFEPYFTTKKAGEGTGLGLAVVHGIVRSHGGSISVYSEIDKGTTFHVYLPVIEEETFEKQDVSTDIIPTGSERILFVDDEQILVEMGQSILERLGYRVRTSTNPIEALELFRADPQQFDLVITDLTMPKMTGDELASELRRIRPDVRIILSTGFSETLNEETLKEAGISVLIRKPILKRHIARVVREVLGTVHN